MEPQKPGQPTSSLYPQGDRSREGNDSLDALTGQMGPRSVTVNYASAKIPKRPLEETRGTQEVTQRKVACIEGITPSAGVLAGSGNLLEVQEVARDFSDNSVWCYTRSEVIFSSSHKTQVAENDSLYQQPLYKNVMYQQPPGNVTYVAACNPLLLYDSGSPKKNPQKTVHLPVVNKQPLTYETFKRCRKAFEDRARTLSENPHFGAITPGELWNLVRDHKPKAILTARLGSQKHNSLSLYDNQVLMDSLARGVACYKRAFKKYNPTEVPKNTTLSQLPPESPLPAPEPTTESGSITKIAMESASPLPSTDCQSLAPPNQPLQAIPPVRATLSNTHKNRCFINSVVHYLRATLSAEDRACLLSAAPEQDSTVTAFVRLFETMDLYEGGHNLKKDEITNKLDDLVIACLKNDYFNGCVRLPEKRQSCRKETKQQPSQEKHQSPQSSRKKSRKQQLRQLEHDDAAGFYMATCNLLKNGLSSMTQMKLYQEMRVSNGVLQFTKNDRAVAHSEPFLALKFSEHDPIQNAIDRFFGENIFSISWAEGDVITSSDPEARIHPGNYPSGITFRLRVGAEFQRLNLRFGMQRSEGGVQSNIVSACKQIKEKILTPIRIPVEYAATDERRNITATPHCIVAHQGSDQCSGHYITLEKSPEGWLLHDDDKPVRLLSGLEQFFVDSPEFTPYLVSYDVT